MLDYKILHDFQAYSEEYTEIYSAEVKECVKLNTEKKLLEVANKINKNISSAYKETKNEKMKEEFKRYSGGTLNDETIIGNLLILKILTDEGAFKGVSKSYFDELNTTYPLKGTINYDKKIWDMPYEYIKTGISIAKENSTFIYKKVFERIDTRLEIATRNSKHNTNSPTQHEITDSMKENFWNNEKKEKISLCIDAGVTNWLVDNIFSEAPHSLENATTGTSLNVITLEGGEKEVQWVEHGLNEKKLLLSGPSGTAARMMLYFLWYHKELEESIDNKITEKLEEILGEGKIPSREEPASFDELKKEYIGIIKAILLPPFDHHSIYEIDSVLAGLHPKFS